MKIAIIGGKLQGVEAAYLAGKIGWDVTLIDRAPEPPASGLCHQFLQADIATRTNMERLLQPYDLVIPALENQHALDCLEHCSQHDMATILFDFKAYTITSSKIESDKLLASIHIPTPAPCQEDSFPCIVKPSNGKLSSRGFMLSSIQNNSRLIYQQFLENMLFRNMLMAHHTPWKSSVTRGTIPPSR